jgi:hypothetical protein
MHIDDLFYILKERLQYCLLVYITTEKHHILFIFMYVVYVWNSYVHITSKAYFYWI